MEYSVEDIITFEEGFRSRAYLCSESYPTIGIGRKLSNLKNVPLEYYNCLVAEEESEKVWLAGQCEILADQICERSGLGVGYIGYNRLDILVSMAFQLGIDGLFKFKNMWKALKASDWASAEKEALDSLWAKQTPKRAKRHAQVLREGTLTAYRGLL